MAAHGSMVDGDGSPVVLGNGEVVDEQRGFTTSSGGWSASRRACWKGRAERLKACVLQ